MILRHRPLTAWPGRLTEPRVYSPFTASWADTLELLDRELRHLQADADTIVLQVAVSEHECRLDGQLRAGARPAHPGVILSIDSRRHGALSYPCDAFEGFGYGKLPGWKANVRAIALGLEALRKVDRYGIAPNGQQYTGWKQLGAGIAMPATQMTVDEAARFIVDEAVDGNGRRMFDLDDVLDGAGPGPFFKDAYRRAATRLHPDAGGDPTPFRRLTEARDLLARAGTR